MECTKLPKERWSQWNVVNQIIFRKNFFCVWKKSVVFLNIFNLSKYLHRYLEYFTLFLKYSVSQKVDNVKLNRTFLHFLPKYGNQYLMNWYMFNFQKLSHTCQYAKNLTKIEEKQCLLRPISKTVPDSSLPIYLVYLHSLLYILSAP